MDPILISVAFVLGFASRQAGLPPLVGYLVAGFLLNAMNFAGGALLVDLKDVGVTLLLFSIGLKLRLGSLAKLEVWAGASLHMIITVVVFGLGIYLLAAAGLPLFSALDLKLALLIAFALSFSSTVFAVKVLEEKAEMSALHGRVAIGILIVQDILAVIFLTAQKQIQYKYNSKIGPVELCPKSTSNDTSSKRRSYQHRMDGPIMR